MKYITPSTVIGFISVTVVSVVVNMLVFNYLKEQDNPQLSFLLIALTQIIFISILYSICFKYMKAKLQMIDQAIINKDLNSLHAIAGHADESSELSGHLEELLVEDQIDKLHLELDDRVCLDSTADGKQDLRQLLTTIAIKTEKLSTNAHCAISLTNPDSSELEIHAAPSFSNDFIKAINTSDKLLEDSTLIPDLNSAPNWQDNLEALETSPYKSCLIHPLRTSSKEVIGSFAMYYSEAKEKCPLDEQIIKASAEMTGLIIERYQKNNPS